MPVFHVYLNGRRVSTAGVGDRGVLGAHVSWVGRMGGEGRGRAKEELTLDVGGLVLPADEHVRWVGRKLEVGDEVRIVIAEDAVVDRPRRRTRRDPAEELRSQKRYVRAMAKKLGWKIQTR